MGRDLRLPVNAGAAAHRGATLLGRLALSQLTRAFSTAAARRFRLPGKGSLEVGADGDVALVSLDDPRVLEAGELHYRHRLSPYVGRILSARVVATVLHG